MLHIFLNGGENMNPYQQYKQQNIMTASQPELLLMLYNGCIRFIKQGREAMQNADVPKTHENLVKAQNIILEFISTLNLDYEISKNLLMLYDYIYFRLVKANIERDIAALEEALKMVTELRDTWAEAAQQLKGQKAIGG